MARTPRLYWRAVVRGDRKPGGGHIDAGLAWHLATCGSTLAEGRTVPRVSAYWQRRAIPTANCLIEGACPAAPPPARTEQRRTSVRDNRRQCPL